MLSLLTSHIFEVQTSTFMPKKLCDTETVLFNDCSVYVTCRWYSPCGRSLYTDWSRRSDAPPTEWHHQRSTCWAVYWAAPHDWSRYCTHAILTPPSTHKHTQWWCSVTTHPQCVCVCVCVTHSYAAQHYTDFRAKLSDVELRWIQHIKWWLIQHIKRWLIQHIKWWLVQYIDLRWVLWRSCTRGLSRLLLLEHLENTTELRIAQDGLLPSAHVSGKQLLHRIPDTHTHTHTHTERLLHCASDWEHEHHAVTRTKLNNKLHH